MPLEIVTFQLGPMQNNSYLVADPKTNAAVVIDPSFGAEAMLAEAQRRNWTLQAIWLTHAHFDHIAGIDRLVEGLEAQSLPVGLHPDDEPLLHQGGGGKAFGVNISTAAKPSIFFTDGQVLSIGSQTVEVHHTPGHTPGHVVFYAAQDQVVFCGDLIFYHGVGRTDLPGGDSAELLESIHNTILTLPPATRLLSGHGPETRVAEERQFNPFL